MSDVKKLHRDLEHWIEIDTAFDIVDSPFQRFEYSPYVVTSFVKKIPLKDIAEDVLKQLQRRIQDEVSQTPLKVELSFKMKLLNYLKRLKCFRK